MLALLAALTGCAARYHEPTPGVDGVAYVEAVAPVWLTGIDGKKISYISVTGIKRFRVSAGPHVAVVRYAGRERVRVPAEKIPRGSFWDGVPVAIQSHTHSRNDVPLQFVAEADRTYFIQDGRQGTAWAWKPFISDSREPVYLDIQLK